MANIIKLGGGGGSTPVLITKSITQNGNYNASSDNADGYSEVIVAVSGGMQTISLHEGLLDINNGNITSDSNYYYSDEFDMPSGYVLFDFGAISYTTGIALYNSDSTYYNGFSNHQSRRYVSFSSYYQAGRKARLSFAKANIQDVIVFDYSAHKVYTGSTPIVTAE